MASLLKNKPWIVVLGSISLSLLTINQVNAAVAVIVNPKNTSIFDKSTIKKIFLGKSKSFENGRPAITLSPEKSSPEREEFNRQVLNKSSNQVNAYWSKMVFTGKGIPPQEMASASEIISAIAANEDAISYVDANDVTDAVKVVATF